MRAFSISILASMALLTGCAGAPKPSEAVAGFDARLTQFSYPFPVKQFTLQSQNQSLEMAYMDIAAENPNGKTVLLLHGKNFSGFYWEKTIRSLTARGFRVIVPDQIGFGKSSKPERYQFSFQGLSRNTKDLLDSLQIGKVAVVGHSMGGMLASRFALMYPEATSSLTLVNPIGLEDWKTMASYKSIDEIYRQELKATRDSIREYQKMAYYDGQWKPEYEAMIEAAAGWTTHPDFPKVAWNSALTAEMIFTQPVMYEFARIKAPTLLIIGLRDKTAIGRAWAAPEVAAKMGDYTRLGKQTARAIPKSRLVELRGVGHMPQVEAYSQYEKALLDFLVKN